MTENITFDLNQLYSQIKEQGEREGVTDAEGYLSLVEDVVNEKVDVGELHSDQNIEQIIEDLRTKWPDYEKNLKIH